jgi:hypothetical protein
LLNAFSPKIGLNMDPNSGKESKRLNSGTESNPERKPRRFIGHLHQGMLRVYTSGASWATVCQDRTQQGNAQRAEKTFADRLCERRGLT